MLRSLVGSEMCIRDSSGVRVTDMGSKPVLDGNGNSRVWFDNVRVGEDALLDRFSRFNQEGEYESEILKKHERFMVAADQLMSGRVCIGSASVLLAQICSLTAIRYARKAQHGKDSDVRLFQHMTHRRTLLTNLAVVLALRFSGNVVKELWTACNILPRPQEISASQRAHMNTHVCAYKSHATQEAVRIAQESRDKCGGQALTSDNRLAELVHVAVSLVVVEGDGAIMAQKAARDLLTPYVKGGVLAVGKAMARQLVDNAWLRALLPSTLVDPATLEKILAIRQRGLELSLALGMAKDKRAGLSTLDAWSKHHLGLATHLHVAFSEYSAFVAFRAQLDRCQDRAAGELLRRFLVLYGLRAVEGDMGWLVGNTGFPAGLAARCTELVDSACLSVSLADALVLVKEFEIPEELLDMYPISREQQHEGHRSEALDVKDQAALSEPKKSR
eukprot:TRINITY_DN10816_c0_g1_i7.p1 TRINITY_DN10816_c0_g1~~TRINITY_DN10816_c0_g1_i7.p1  ORF type:complete len:489 (+),score=143.34 TRINITY_DN10816_c0_g1_i7:131-1468(+)